MKKFISTVISVMLIIENFCLIACAENAEYCSEHQLIYSKVEPSCTEDGFTIVKCKACSYEEKIDITPSSGHILTSKSIVEPTCTEEGYSVGKCIVCQEIVYEDFVEPKAHDFTSLKRYEPTCTEEGYTVYGCSVCGYTENRDCVEALGHTYGDLITKAPADCEHDGEGTYVCQRCFYEKPVIISAAGHKFCAQITEPNCTEQGFTTYMCQNCGQSYTDDYTSPLGHIIVGGERSEASCTKDGFVNGTYCSRCSEIFSADKIIQAKGHIEIFDSEVAPTCTKYGLSAGKYCLVCSEIIIPQEKIAPIGHKYEKVVTKPACTKQGYTTYTCTKCGDSYVDSYTNPLGHSFDNDSEFCIACGELNPDYVSPLPTSKEDIQSSTASTASSDNVSESIKSSSSTDASSSTSQLNIISSEIMTEPVVSNSQITSAQYPILTDNSDSQATSFNGSSTGNSTPFETSKITKAVPENALKIKGEWISKRQKKTYIRKLVKAKKAFKVSWKKVSGITGYQIQYSTSKKFYSKKTKAKTITKRKISSATVKKLKSKKKYYVRMRTYKSVKLSGKKYKVFSSWSKVKTVKTK